MNHEENKDLEQSFEPDTPTNLIEDESDDSPKIIKKKSL